MMILFCKMEMAALVILVVEERRKSKSNGDSGCDDDTIFQTYEGTQQQFQTQCILNHNNTTNSSSILSCSPAATFCSARKEAVAFSARWMRLTQSWEIEDTIRVSEVLSTYS